MTAVCLYDDVDTIVCVNESVCFCLCVSVSECAALCVRRCLWVCLRVCICVWWWEPFGEDVHILRKILVNEGSSVCSEWYFGALPREQFQYFSIIFILQKKARNFWKFLERCNLSRPGCKGLFLVWRTIRLCYVYTCVGTWACMCRFWYLYTMSSLL